jgi:hypothetical protein
VVDLIAAPLVQVPVAGEAQGEAVAWLPDGSGYLTVGEDDAPVLSATTCN